jgi:hypothetical protein
MALPSSGAISTTQIMTELAIAVQSRTWPSLWALAVAGSIPKNKANAGGPYILPNDWWGYPGTCMTSPFTSSNSMKCQSSSFATARTVYQLSESSGLFFVTAQLNNLSLFDVSRAYWGFDCSSIVTATQAYFKLTTTASGGSVLRRYVLVKPNTPKSSYNQWTSADYNIGNGGTVISNILTVAAGQPAGVLTFGLNAAGITYIQTNPKNVNFVLMEYDYDYLNVTPSSQSNVGLMGSTSTATLCTGSPSVFTPYSYTGQVRCVSSGPVGQYVFEVTIDTYGAPSWNQIVTASSTIQVSQGGTSTNGAKFPVHVGGTVYQCSSVVGFNYDSNATMTVCNIRVSDGTTDHMHTFAVPLTFVPAEMINATYKNINVNVT